MAFGLPWGSCLYYCFDVWRFKRLKQSSLRSSRLYAASRVWSCLLRLASYVAIEATRSAARRLPQDSLHAIPAPSPDGQLLALSFLSIKGNPESQRPGKPAAGFCHLRANRWSSWTAALNGAP